MALVSMISVPITEIAATGIIALLVLLVSANPGGVATLVAFVAILYRLQPRLMTLFSAQSQLASLDASIAAVGELLQGEVESRICNEMRPVIDGPVSFRNVTFAMGTPACRRSTSSLSSSQARKSWRSSAPPAPASQRCWT